MTTPTPPDTGSGVTPPGAHVVELGPAAGDLAVSAGHIAATMLGEAPRGLLDEDLDSYLDRWQAVAGRVHRWLTETAAGGE